jgi:hypothetical protein
MVNKQTTKLLKLNIRAFNIFQVYQYFTIYRQYFFFIKIGTIFMTILYNPLKSGDTKDNIRRVKVPGTALYWKAWIILINCI